MRRVNLTSIRDSLNGYQKGKCFYTNKYISIEEGNQNLCGVDHLLPHINKELQHRNGANINGVWNLVLADSSINREKNARVPEIKYLEKLYLRNEFYIESKHPLAETIFNQTGENAVKRAQFLQYHYNLAMQQSIHTWSPSEIIDNDNLMIV